MSNAFEFGGSGAPLHFTHANGFPPAAYSALLGALTHTCRVFAMRTRPLTENTQPNGLADWSPLADDLIEFLENRGEGAVFGAGHSMGAIITLLAALRRPDMFRAVILLDPVLFSPRFSAGWGVVKKLGLANKLNPLVGAALRRRRVFESAHYMFERYRRAPTFKRMNDDALRAYVGSLAHRRADGQVTLAYPPEWEAAIYATAPHDLWDKIGGLRVPLMVLWGEQSDTFLPRSIRALKKILPTAHYRSIADAGHLVPLEKPAEVANEMLVFLACHSQTIGRHDNL